MKPDTMAAFYPHGDYVQNHQFSEPAKMVVIDGPEFVVFVAPRMRLLMAVIIRGIFITIRPISHILVMPRAIMSNR
jgi:hypothetical protein